MDDTEALGLFLDSYLQLSAAKLPVVDPACVTSIDVAPLCTLWAGMGTVFVIRVSTSGGVRVSFIVKRVQMPTVAHRSFGDERKRRSYQVEANFYAKGYAERLINAGVRVPYPLHTSLREDGVTICMSQLHGESARCLGLEMSRRVLTALAVFHAEFWGTRASSATLHLQAQGGYWYLDTRPEEYRAMPTTGWEGRLRLAARAIDMRLKSDDRLLTVIHGDAKAANILFSPSGEPLIYDFQYCGVAVATKDLAYFLTCGSDAPATARAGLLDHYLRELSSNLTSRGDALKIPSMDELTSSLELAICDLGRWMSGWGWWGKDISHEIIRTLDRLDSGKALSEKAYVEAVLREFPTF